MEHFARTLYTKISTAQKDMKEHARLKMRNNALDEDHTMPLYKLPSRIYSEIKGDYSTKYLPKTIVEPEKLFDTMVHYVRVIPESGTRIDLYLLDGLHCVKMNEKQKRFLVNTIELYIRVLEQMSRSKQTTVTMVLIPTHHKKQMDFDVSTTFSSIHVNTGVTYKNMTDRFIIIYRHEEIFKVILHELLHLYDFDFYEYDSTNYIYDFTTKFNIDTNKLGLNESFNDALTIAMYLGFYTALREPKSFKTFTTFLERYNHNFVHMRNYLIKMSAKLRLYSKKHFGGVTKEQTHVFAYYHGKAALIANSRTFFLFMKRNKNSIPQSNEHIHTFSKLLSKCLRSREYKERIKLYSQSLVETSTQFFMNTLRMCNYDLDRDAITKKEKLNTKISAN